MSKQPFFQSKRIYIHLHVGFVQYHRSFHRAVWEQIPTAVSKIHWKVDLFDGIFCGVWGDSGVVVFSSVHIFILKSAQIFPQNVIQSANHQSAISSCLWMICCSLTCLKIVRNRDMLEIYLPPSSTLQFEKWVHLIQVGKILAASWGKRGKKNIQMDMGVSENSGVFPPNHPF